MSEKFYWEGVQIRVPIDNTFVWKLMDQDAWEMRCRAEVGKGKGRIKVECRRVIGYNVLVKSNDAWTVVGIEAEIMVREVIDKAAEEGYDITPMDVWWDRGEMGRVCAGFSHLQKGYNAVNGTGTTVNFHDNYAKPISRDKYEKYLSDIYSD